MKCREGVTGRRVPGIVTEQSARQSAKGFGEMTKSDRSSTSGRSTDDTTTTTTDGPNRAGLASKASDDSLTVIPDPAPTGRDVRLDRSQARLRLRSDIVAETLRIANNLSFADTSLDSVANVDDDVVRLLEERSILIDGTFDPLAAELLYIVNQASLMITIDLRYGADASHRTIWATPRAAVVSNDIDEGVVELQPTDVAQLPTVLSQLLLARSPRYVGASPISISTEAVARAERHLGDGDPEAATTTLIDAGLSDEQARIVNRFESNQVRRWKIASAWSTEDGQDERELRGIDADTEGQWLLAMTGSTEDDRGQITFSPQGHGDVMRSLRSILPKMWIGTPLKPAAV